MSAHTRDSSNQVRDRSEAPDGPSQRLRLRVLRRKAADRNRELCTARAKLQPPQPETHLPLLPYLLRLAIDSKSPAHHLDSTCKLRRFVVVVRSQYPARETRRPSRVY